MPTVDTAMSKAEIRKLIRSRGDYQNVKRFPHEYLDTEIQLAFGEFWQIVDEAHQGWWDTDGTVTTVAAQSYIGLPVDAKVVKGVDRLDGSEWVEMYQAGTDRRNRFSTNTGEPIEYRLSARGLELAPTPDKAYTLRVMYAPKAPLLTENERREWYEGWVSFIVEKVLWELDSREGKPLGDREKKLGAAEKTLRASASARRQAEPEYLALREGLSSDPFNTGLID